MFAPTDKAFKKLLKVRRGLHPGAVLPVQAHPRQRRQRCCGYGPNRRLPRSPPPWQALDLTAEELLADKDTLNAVLKYHVIGGAAIVR